jgi:hypothetical protein
MTMLRHDELQALFLQRFPVLGDRFAIGLVWIR